METKKGLTDLHIHSVYSDGNSSPGQIIQRAIELKMSRVGISDHSYTFFDTRYCMREENIERYRAEINALKEKYAPEIKVLCGIEQDYWSEAPTDGYDYVIGSVHYIRCGENEYRTVDSGKNAGIGIGFLKSAADDFFGGDMYAVMEKYYETAADLINRTGADIIGHFDIITKFNDGNMLFDEDSARYKKAATDAIDALLPYNRPFEINTGAVARGFKKHPYPSPKLIDYIKERGGSFVLSSDAHRPENICFGFERYKDLICR